MGLVTIRTRPLGHRMARPNASYSETVLDESCCQSSHKSAVGSSAPVGQPNKTEQELNLRNEMSPSAESQPLLESQPDGKQSAIKDFWAIMAHSHRKLTLTKNKMDKGVFE